MTEAKNEIIECLECEGYFDLRYIEGFGYCGLLRFMYTVGLVIAIDKVGYRGRYCFPSLADARESFRLWDGKGHPQGNWIKYKGYGEEFSNPNNLVD